MKGRQSLPLLLLIHVATSLAFRPKNSHHPATNSWLALLRGGEGDSNSSTPSSTSPSSSDTILNYVEHVSARDQAASIAAEAELLQSSEDESEIKLRRKENAVGDPSDSDNDDDDLSGDSSDYEMDGDRIGPLSVGGSLVNTQHEMDAEVDYFEEIPEYESNEEDTDGVSSSNSWFDKALVDAFQPLIYSPPPEQVFHKLSESTSAIDVASRRRLDRRVLYESLLLELENSPVGKRRYLDQHVVRTVKGAISLACQPRWRKHMDGNWYCRGIRLYDTPEESEDTSPQNPYMEEEDEDESQVRESVEATMAMQETVAMAFAHSLNCGLVLLDDTGFEGVRQALVNDPHLKLDEKSPELKSVVLLNHLIRLANEGKLRKKTTGKISSRMERDIALGLDDPFDELAIESMKLMRDEERSWMESIPHDENDPDKALPLVLFLRVNAASNLLKSKSFVDRLARECVSDDSIHVLFMGKGIDATTVNLPQSSEVNDGVSTLRKKTMQPLPSLMGGPNNDVQTSQQEQSTPFNPFAGMSSIPPPGMAGLPFNMNSQSGFQPGNPFGFNQQNINASGINDPEGSRRFNIFLARTVEKDGNAGIMGAIAPPQAGNLFPQMLALQARENYIKSQQDGDSEEEQQKFEAEMLKWKDLMEKHEFKTGSSVPPQFFSASIQQQDSNKVDGNGNNPFQNMIPPPPEMIQQAIEHAVDNVMERFSNIGKEHRSGKDGIFSSDLAKAFAQVLSNQSLRRGIAENLARAAPALVDPRCQGVMLSVYVPPPPNHPNHGLMPGQQRQKSKKQAKKAAEKDRSNPTNPGVGGWLNKILSSQNVARPTDSQVDSTKTDDSEEEEDSSNTVTEDSSLDVSALNETLTAAASKTLRKRDRQARAAAVAAATAMISDHEKQMKKISEVDDALKDNTLSSEQKVQKHLTRLQALCKNVSLKPPLDPVRSHAWVSWANREKAAIIFRKNRRALNDQLMQRNLALDERTGTKVMGSTLRRMLSSKDVSVEMDSIITCAVELEAAKSQRGVQTTNKSITIDASMNQLKSPNFGDNRNMSSSVHGKIHPKSLEKALTVTCHISPSSGGSPVLGNFHSIVHRTREEISELAQDKHERALVSQVVLPQDIGVNYDMIGGLADVKELLRQSITYPLKYPYLYSEGIAREAVKGVLLVSHKMQSNNS
jgi:ATPases of the AAA+ class